ncbi:P-loop NTPase family protein [Paraburkholderia xenovorans]|uniref:hypothetical protein n=1 Tax=Paraburkholderia xenovorans TaxID=36873 RepID=UPI0038B94E0B
MKVTPAQLTELLSLYVPKRLPVLITGRPGIGKSDIVEQVAHATDHELLISHPVVEDPTDSKGLPFPAPDGLNAKFLPFGDLERAMKARRPLIWFLDDLGQASPAVQAAKMQLLLARRIGEHVFPPASRQRHRATDKKSQPEGWPREFVFPRVVITNLREVSLYRRAAESISRKDASLGRDSLSSRSSPPTHPLTLRCSCKDEWTRRVMSAPGFFNHISGSVSCATTLPRQSLPSSFLPALPRCSGYHVRSARAFPRSAPRPYL